MGSPKRTMEAERLMCPHSSRPGVEESEWAVSVSSAWQSWAAKLGLCTPRCPDLPRHGGWNGEGVYGDCERLSGMREIAMCV